MVVVLIFQDDVERVDNTLGKVSLVGSGEKCREVGLPECNQELSIEC